MSGDTALRGRRIVLLRHGKVAANLEGRYIGREDPPLCSQGEAELRALCLPGVDAVFSSPLRRCTQTAGLLYPGQDPIVLDHLQERDFGQFSGRTHAEITALPGWEKWGMDEEHMPFPGGEDMGEFELRCACALEWIRGKMRRERFCTAAVITHGGVIMALMRRIAGQGFYRWQCANGGGYLLEWKRAGEAPAINRLGRGGGCT